MAYQWYRNSIIHSIYQNNSAVKTQNYLIFVIFSFHIQLFFFQCIIYPVHLEPTPPAGSVSIRAGRWSGWWPRKILAPGHSATPLPLSTMEHIFRALACRTRRRFPHEFAKQLLIPLTQPATCFLCHSLWCLQITPKVGKQIFLFTFSRVHTMKWASQTETKRNWTKLNQTKPTDWQWSGGIVGLLDCWISRFLAWKVNVEKCGRRTCQVKLRLRDNIV